MAKIAGMSTVHAVSFAGLANCVDESRRTWLDGDPGPADPTDYHNLRGRLESARLKLPPLYRSKFADPYVATLDQLGAAGFTQILAHDPQHVSTAGVMFDIAQAILQKGEGYQPDATDAFEEVVSDLYDGFLSAEDRRGVQPPDKGVIPPLVKWGNPDDGPYTWPVDATSNFGAGAGVVSLPPAQARLGVLGWAALGHETAGHDILDADTGLRGQLADAVHIKLKDAGLKEGLPSYWADRIDETASDVMGILNMGPAAAIGLVGYFRGINAAFGDSGLRNDGPADDPHPADILRGFLGSATVRRLSFSAAKKWADSLDNEIMKDVTSIVILGKKIKTDTARASADAVAEALTAGKAASLENHALGDIQDWRDSDEKIVLSLRKVLTKSAPLPASIGAGIYAAHAVAAAVYEAVAKGVDLPTLFSRMLAVLKKMHDQNPSWGPLFVAHPGNLSRRLSYNRAEAEGETGESEG